MGRWRWGDGAGRGEKAEKGVGRGARGKGGKGGVGYVECGAGKFGCARVKGVR